ncbi:hypothetical protein [Nitratireductor sp. GCM10026969]|uniref:hypothetical protein n=1 Tax=Nitratireductor sp. GCM10026969 TaxID=3252645 RepID=UPI0036223FF0
MARLLHWPMGLPENFREPLSGPRSIGSGSNTSIGNFTQTVGSPFGAWRWRFQFANMRGQIARRYRGWITALHGGANATRVPFCDWDGLDFEQMGVITTRQAWRLGQPWSNGEPWSNGKNWASSPPQVPVARPSPLNGTEIWLAEAFWGHRLGMGDLIGFFPFHLGLYEITQVFDPGHYRVWPPLRKALTTDDEATLRPTLAMRLENEDAATAPRDAHFISNAGVVLVEVFDYYVRDYFTD